MKRLHSLTLNQIQQQLQQQKKKKIRFFFAKPRKAVVALCLRQLNQEWQILMIQRAKREGDPWSGHMAFPGGHQDPEDQNEIATAYRETQEEVGLNLENATYLGALHPVRAMAKGIPIRLVIHPHVFFLPELPHSLSPNEEVAETVWISLERLLSGDCDSRHTFTRGKIQIELPCWNYEKYTIWGLSYRMLSTFLAILPVE